MQAKPPRAGIPLVLQELREVTGDKHRALERRLPFNLPVLDRVLYRRLIEAYYGFYAGLEQQLDELGALDADNGADRHKIPALTRDLRALGLSSSMIAGLARCQELPPINNRSQLLGVMYVIEGATLGGQVLRRIVSEKLSIDADNGGAFLDVYDGATGPLWKAFLGMLSQVVDPVERALVTHSALATFSCFERWLERSEVLQ
jgi:heme oxygenase